MQLLNATQSATSRWATRPARHRTKRWLSTACVSLLAALALSPTAASAANPDATCPRGHVCVWTQSDFRGTPRAFGAADVTPDHWRLFENRKLSIANRFANRKVWTWSGYGYDIRCLNPGDRMGAGPFIGSMAIYIWPEGTRC